MTLVDASAWVELLRDTGSPTDRRLRRLLRSGDELATSDPVAMQLLAGARTSLQGRKVRGVLASCRNLAVRPPDWEAAASVYGTCRAAGTTPRGLLDCLLAAVAIRSGIPILTADRDFEAIAQQTRLELA